jgi:small conductance mechanosensitive channel
MNFTADDRLLANLIALHVLLGALLLLSILVRRILIQGSATLVRWTGMRWLNEVNEEATRKIRAVLFWSTLSLMAGSIAGAVVYQIMGRDIRLDLHDWYQHLTAQQLLQLGWMFGQLVGLAVGLYFGLRLVRWGRVRLEAYAVRFLPKPETPEETPAAAAPTTSPTPPAPSSPVVAFAYPAPEPAAPPAPARHDHDDTVQRWFGLLERFLIATVFLTTLWLAGHVVHLSNLVDPVIRFLMRMLTILMVARLLTLACRTIFHTMENLGNRHLATGQFRRYWERVTRLFPFGEKCFEAAVYISAGTLIVRELEFIAVIAELGPRLVECIGIFFVTRVLIELVQVLLHEGFGCNDENRPLDQKGQTLVPLLQSISQYALYFGSAVIMMGVMGIDTRPILAGAGILGLAGGLGAQSLVTDVVSGFFILFENQYLVGDVVKIGDAQGRVEAVSIRCTQIRDEQGKLNIIPNGQVKSVINFSKGFVNAVVDIKVPVKIGLEQILGDMAEAGKRMRQHRREVLGETLVKGLVDLTPSEMTIRAVTKVQPGTHEAMQNEYRRQLKLVFDERNSVEEKKLAA